MEARALQLHAYKAAIDALRASSNPNSPGTIKLLRQLRNVFKVSELRHAAEVRRACSDPQLAQLSEVSAAAWLRKVRRPVESGPLIGVRRESRRKLADELVKQISQSSSEQELPTVHLSLDSEELKARLSSPPSTAAPTPSVEKKTEHVIHLPRGTIITVGEEKQESTKPGRKRKGDMVIKEVKMIEKKRQRRKPPRFQQSPDKHIVKNAIRAARRRQCIDHALKKTKIEVKTEPAQVVQVKPEATPKTNGHAAVEVKPQVQQVQQQVKKIVKQQQHLPQTNLVTTATTVLMKPTVYTVTQPMQAVHIVSNHHPKTISSASVAQQQQQSASSFSMADILNKDATTSASSRPSSAAPPGATAPSTASSGGSNHVTPTKPPNIDVTPSANSTKVAQYPQQSPLPQSPQLQQHQAQSRKPAQTANSLPSTQAAQNAYYQQQQKNAEHTQELQRKILGTSAAKTPSYIGAGPIVDVTPRGVGRAPTPGQHKEHAYAKSYVMAGQQQQQQRQQQQQTTKQQATMRKQQQQQQSRVHQTVTSLPSSYQRAASSPAYVLPPNYAVPLDLQQRQLLRPGVHLVDNQALLTQNPHTLISTGLQRPLLLHPSFPGTLIGHPGQPGGVTPLNQLQLNGQATPYSSIELARLQQTQPNNNNR